MKARFPILWLTGNTGAGKTTLAEAVEEYMNEAMPAEHPLARRCIVLDGDHMRATISVDETLSAEDRRRHNLRVARLAGHLRDRGFLVIVAVIAPFASVRKEIDAECSPVWIYVKRSDLAADNKPYEEPSDAAMVIDNDVLDAASAADLFRSYILDTVSTSGML